MNRFLSATAMGGRLHLRDIGDYGSWESSRIDYINEQELNPILARMMVIRKVLTVEELDEVLRASEDRPGSISFYLSEGLLDEARSRWEAMRKNLTTQTQDEIPFG